MDVVEGGVSGYCLKCRYWKKKCVFGYPRVKVGEFCKEYERKAVKK